MAQQLSATGRSSAEGHYAYSRAEDVIWDALPAGLPINTVSTKAELIVRFAAAGDVEMQTALPSTDRTAMALVPVILSEYIAMRSSDPTRVLGRLIAATNSRLSTPLSPNADVHYGLKRCPKDATTVLTKVGNCIETIIATKDWTVSAREDATEFSYVYAPQFANGFIGRPLRDVIDLAILPPELIIENVAVSHNSLGTYFCNGFTRPFGHRPNEDFKRLNEVSGAVSRSHRPY